jgi:hypothetical protein
MAKPRNEMEPDTSGLTERLRALTEDLASQAEKFGNSVINYKDWNGANQGKDITRSPVRMFILSHLAVGFSWCWASFGMENKNFDR